MSKKKDVVVTEDDLTEQAIESANEVYKFLGGGYEETIYEEAVAVEFRKRNIKYEVEKYTEVFYKGEKVGTHRLDFIIENKLVVELKSQANITKTHIAQTICYLKTLGLKMGLLINFPYSEKDVVETEIVKI